MRREIFDLADGIAVFEKRFDEQHIGVMLSNKFIRLLTSGAFSISLLPEEQALIEKAEKPKD